MAITSQRSAPNSWGEATPTICDLAWQVDLACSLIIFFVTVMLLEELQADQTCGLWIVSKLVNCSFLDFFDRCLNCL